jgi:hypothetical protein
MLKRPGMLAIMLACCLIAPVSALAQAAPADPQRADAEAKKRDEAEKRVQAKAREEAQLKAKREAVQRACVIKPVMSDDEIAKCRAAYAVN